MYGYVYIYIYIYIYVCIYSACCCVHQVFQCVQNVFGCVQVEEDVITRVVELLTIRCILVCLTHVSV